MKTWGLNSEYSTILGWIETIAPDLTSGMYMGPCLPRSLI
jgi:hypothetical protein